MESTNGDEINSQNSESVSFSEASMNVSELNNLVVSLVKPLRDARYRVVRHLSNKMKKLRTSKKDSEVVNKKLANFLDELKEIKSMKLNNDVVKQLLAKAFTEKDLSRAASPSERALIRLALQKSSFNEAVAKFRSEHNDWVSLTKFMLSKHGGRRFRKRNAKVSCEKLAKKTLDVADKKAQELFKKHDQRHQHNKKAAIKPAKNVLSEQKEHGSEEISLLEATASKSEPNAKMPSEASVTWMSSIFSEPKTSEPPPEEADNISLEYVAEKRQKQTWEEGLVVEFDPALLGSRDAEEATLLLPELQRFSDNSSSRHGIKPVSNEDDDGAGFFVPLTGETDEISRSGGRILTSADIGGSENSGNNKRHVAGIVTNREKSRNKHDIKGVTVKPEENLHASWQARRLQRDQQKIKISAAGQSGQSKRIKFDSDDDF